MARIPYEENTRVWFVPAISSLSAPTTTEINAGIELSHFIPKDGFDPGSNDNTIPTGAIDTSFDAEIQGSYGKKLKIDFMLDDTTNTAWTTLPRKTSGFIIHRSNLPVATALASGQKVDVYPVQSGSRMRQKSAANAMQKFQVAFAVTDKPVEDAVVA
jgi:hypothetical protein